MAQRHTGKAEAWYAVGCYYLVTGKLESARTYLSKATTLALPAEAGPAWYPPPPRRVFLLPRVMVDGPATAFSLSRIIR